MLRARERNSSEDTLGLHPIVLTLVTSYPERNYFVYESKAEYRTLN